MSDQTHVVIVGASYAGAGVAHNILKNIPQAKVTVIDPSDVMYFNVAAPRVLARPSDADLGKVLVPVKGIFKQYPASRFTFVQGKVTSLDTAAKSLSLENQEPISYDYVVVASGSTTPGTVGREAIPFKGTGPDIREKIKDAQQRIAKADSIIIVGAGPVGVETAGDIAQAYPKKSVTLVSSHERVLPGLKKSAGSSAESSLRKLGVKIVPSARVTETTHDEASGKSTVALSTGSNLDATLVISAAGNLPNSSFMPASTLDSDGWVKIDQTNLRISGVSDGSAFALGDVTELKQRYMLKVQDQVPVVAGNIKAAITKSAKTVAYDRSDKLMCFVPVGNNAGTGQIGGFVPFSFMVGFVKGKDYFISKSASWFGPK